MSDLSSLMQIAPYAGGYMAGQQNVADINNKDADTERLKQLIQEIQIKNQQAQVMNPLLTQNQSLRNDELSAKIPGDQATSRKLGYEADQKQATLTSDIAAAKSKNQTQIEEDGAKKIRAQGVALYQAGLVGTQGGPAGALETRKRLAALNIPQDSPFMQMSPQQVLEQGQKLISSTEDYFKSIETERMKATSAEKVANIHESGATKRNNDNIEAGKYSKKDSTSFENYYSKLRSAKDKYTALIDEAQKARAGNNTALAASLIDRAMEIKPMVDAELANPNAGKIDPTALGNPRIQAPKAPDVTPPSQRGVGGPSPAGAADIITGAKEAWGAYEPTKYEYRIGPNGKLQRKPKGS